MTEHTKTDSLPGGDIPVLADGRLRHVKTLEQSFLFSAWPRGQRSAKHP